MALAVVDEPNVAEVSADAMTCGIELAQFYSGEVIRLLEAGATDPELRLAEQTRQWLRGASWGHALVSLPDLYQRGPNPIRDKKRARKIADLLEQHGWLRRLEGSAEVNGVRRRMAWEIVRP